MAMPAFTDDACGGVINVSVAVPFIVALQENPTTGYRWDFEADPGLEITASSYSFDPGGGIGGGGVRQVIARADRAGSFMLRGKLWRSWAGDASIIKRCDITVQAS